MKCPDCDSPLEKKLNKRKRPFWKCTNPVCKFWGNSGTGKPKSESGDPGTGKAKEEVPKTPKAGKEGAGGDPPKPKSTGFLGIDFGF